ncbi:MAG: hypothetical protein CV089_02205 [Nitrospira sp. WS110]|nr:hypothetical protein [Nitrospira sp. WS110]
MPPAEIELVRNVNLPLGTRTYPPTGGYSVDDDVTWIELTFTANQWTNPAAVADVQILMSVNGGPFVLWRGFGANGRPVDARFPTTFVGGTPFEGVNRRIRVVNTVSGARFRTTITVKTKV